MEVYGSRTPQEILINLRITQLFFVLFRILNDVCSIWISISRRPDHHAYSLMRQIWVYVFLYKMSQGGLFFKCVLAMLLTFALDFLSLVLPSYFYLQNNSKLTVQVCSPSVRVHFVQYWKTIWKIVSSC